ncbi:MAG: DUF151 domain-containing protein [Coriobacteriales bacterium]|jgi:bifunctional DNase/RNase|nr:DUF151 domain-containing protein [Coriobacteriales bacterium]
MVEMSIFSVVMVGPELPSVVVLAPKLPWQNGDGQARVVLPIWIGRTEAESIFAVLKKRRPQRPATHDLLANTIGALGAKLVRVVVDRVQDSTFFATLYLNRGGRTIQLDARPSDSIALALRLEAPIFVDEDVMNAAAQRFVTRLADTRQPLEDSEAAMDEFRDFLSSISPEDFSNNT